MMKKLINYVAAESGGALTILEKYYEEALMDKNNSYIFLLSIANLKSQDNVKVLNYRWIKKSWFHRLFFDFIVAPVLVKKLGVTEVISLQNTLIPRVDVKQSVYLHQFLPFSKKRYKIYDNPKYWVYQNVVKVFIEQSIKKADVIIVQSRWIIDEIPLLKNKIVKVEPPIVSFRNNDLKYRGNEESKKIFFYPTSAESYKNYELIFNAILNIQDDQYDLFEVNITLNGDETNILKNIKFEAERLNLPLKFIGYQNKTQMDIMYSKSILLFPSYVESFGLPLMEASKIGAPILASDMPFSKEILNEYQFVKYFDPNSYEELAKYMEQEIMKL